ncbi:cation acetate symporter [Geomonas sp. Red69]|uniref:Cation acetate symporter n=1 Tax=Geomonas diazotrophica TaxID=2843197 RepID=A0ABX8JCK5_9BACT|nr:MULTISPECIES: cation acetate symporter [Geomonas]MBU5636248.1 cation acetate symporter [Geomonas diazotrophica]QWV96143.1 cation acetate symporter [Geomonas nitrogeniifigens]QXE85210.1 cation acetate symporter [Geomonas nitrogeniifigens]
MKKRIAALTVALSLSMFGAAAVCAEASATAAAPQVAAPAAAVSPAAAPASAAASQVAAPAASVAAKAAVAPAKGGAAPAKITPNRGITIGMFALIIAVTMGVVIWAAKKTQTASDFYTAGGGITGFQNGWAIAGDYMSAASFLGMSGLISLYGIDGFMYAVGPMFSFIAILLVIAEPCRNAGKYTLGDILCFRSSPKVVRGVAALSTVTVSIFYLIAQMVGAGKLMQMLLNIPYRVSVIGVGALMVAYVVFGGMKATTWVQIIKASLLMGATTVLCLLVAIKAGFNPVRFFTDVVSNGAIQEHVRMNVLKDVIAKPGVDYGQRFLEPGLFLKNPLDQISLGLAWALGAAGLPHILMRFFTVPSAKDARKSIIVALFLNSSFFFMISVIGFGAALYLTPQAISAVDKGGNMATLLLAQHMGGGAGSLGGDIFLAFICAVAFATILAVVSGLVLAASAAIAHDVYVNIIKDGKADQQLQVKVARITSLFVGTSAIVMGLMAEKENVVALVALAFAVAASGNFPVIMLSLFWRKFNTAGIVSGLVVGTISALTLVMVSPVMTYPKKIAADAKKVVETLEKKQAGGTVLAEKEVQALEKSRTEYVKNKDGKSMVGLDAPIFPLKNPGIVSVPLGFLAAVFGCLLFRERRAEEMFDEIDVRQNTGIGITSAADH